MSVLRVLDKLESYVRSGTWLPAGYRILSEERLLELVEKMRASLPDELERARRIAQGQDLVLRAAQEQAQAIVEEAAVKHEELVDRHEIVERARRTAEAVLRDAEERARRVREGADQYAAQVLAEMETRMSAALASIRKGREALAARPGTPASRPLAEAAADSKRAAFDLQAEDETTGLESVRP